MSEKDKSASADKKVFNFTYRGNEMNLYEIVDERFVHVQDGGKIIIERWGIAQICQHFDFALKDYSVHDGPKGELLIKATMQKRGVDYTFVGDGEASNLNVDGLGLEYPQATALHRAVARAVIRELNIMAFGEDEATAFKQNAPQKSGTEISDADLQVIQNNLTVSIKEHIRDQIIEINSGLKKPFDDETLPKFIMKTLGLNKGDSIDTDDVTVEQMIEILLAVSNRPKAAKKRAKKEIEKTDEENSDESN